MGTPLVGFIYKTLARRFNDPGNASYWLPKRLSGIDKPEGGKLLPLSGETLDIGEVQGEAGGLFRDNIKGQWWGFQSRRPGVEAHQPIVSPKTPWPVLSLSQTSILGLDNVFVMPNPGIEDLATGYRLKLPLTVGYYGTQHGLVPLTVKGHYALALDLCSAAATAPGTPMPTEPDGWASDHIVGTGRFATVLTDAFLDATVRLEVAGDGPGRGVMVTVEAIAMRGPDASAPPTLQVQDLALDTAFAWMSKKVWLPRVQAVLTSQEGREGLVQNVNAALAQDDNRRRIGEELTTAFGKAVDDAIGATAPGHLPSGGAEPGTNAIDQYLFDRLRYAVNDPNSAYYLPKALCGSTDPVIEPFAIGEASLGDQTVQDGLTLDDIRLLDVAVAGLSNIAAPAGRARLSGGGVVADLEVGTLSDPPSITVTRGGTRQTITVPPPPMRITGRLATHLDGDDTPITCAYALTVDRCTVSAALAFGGSELDDLRVDLHELAIAAPSDALHVAVDIDSDFKDIIAEVLDQTDLKQKALAEINHRAASALTQISNAATDGVRRALKAKLDG